MKAQPQDFAVPVPDREHAPDPLQCHRKRGEHYRSRDMQQAQVAHGESHLRVKAGESLTVASGRHVRSRGIIVRHQPFKRAAQEGRL